MEDPGKEPFTNLIWAVLEGVAIAFAICTVPYIGIGASMFVLYHLGVEYDSAAISSLAIGLIISMLLVVWGLHRIYRIWKGE
jgi:hypothetical protein